MNIDIIHSELENLLLATPFTNQSERNFSNTIGIDEFFDNMYSSCVVEGEEDFVESNIEFNEDISQIVNTFDNPHMRVKLLHIVGYSGCGKTTYIQHLIWQSEKTQCIKLCYLDFEGYQTAENPIKTDIEKRLSNVDDIQDLITFLEAVSNTESFRGNSLSIVHLELELFRECLFVISKNSGWSMNSPHESMNQMADLINEDNYLLFLLVLDFLLLIFERFREDTERVYIVIDNIDSMDPISEEIRLVPAIAQFVNVIYSFVNANINRDSILLGKRVGDVFSDSKFIYFLTTRFVTANRHVFRSDELSNEWKTIHFPKQYYSHRDIVKTKTDYLKGQVSTYLENERVKKLNHVYQLMGVMYTNQLYKRLFNGNFKHCIRTLCYFENKRSFMNKFEPCLENQNNSKIPSDGINGIIINSIFNYFKDNGIYKEKLGLVKCERDGLVTCSRLVLTIVRELDHHCSILEIYKRLHPVFTTEEISICTYSLSEAKRHEWRRLIIFEGKIYPESSTDLIDQGKRFETGDYNEENYTELRLCDAGEAYLENVVPHFEFMLTRHFSTVERDNRILRNPLFTFWGTMDEGTFYDEMKVKVEYVYKDVADCCYNSNVFANAVIDSGIIKEDEYLNSEYNYSTSNQYTSFRQTYEARLIFSHIGYLERFRRYLLSMNGSYRFKRKMNRLLVSYILKYLDLYDEIEPKFRNEAQNIAAGKLKGLANTIKKKKDEKGYEYMDFTTRIDLSV